MDSIGVFAVLVLGIIVLPGMDMALVAGVSLGDGRRAGLVAVAGIITGGVVHVALGLLGVGVLLQLHPQAFNALLLAGAAYIAWLGWSLCRGVQPLARIDRAEAAPAARIFGRALLTCLLNPKAYVFMLAVFPQFIRRDGSPLLVQAAVLGAIIAATQFVVYGGVALAADALGERIGGSAGPQRALAIGVGSLLIAVAAWTVGAGLR